MASYLLDTHAFIWADSEPEALSLRARSILGDPSSELWLSVASVWEMQIKRQLGRLKTNSSIAHMVEAQVRVNRLRLLDVRLPHVLRLDRLPPIHKDPFDRMLVAQAMAEELTLLSHDPIVRKYPVRVLW
jgi:PIN domain nuclease of toxin-antitoxin system